MLIVYTTLYLLGWVGGGFLVFILMWGRESRLENQIVLLKRKVKTMSILNPEIKVSCKTCGKELNAAWGNFGGELEIEPCETCINTEAENKREGSYQAGYNNALQDRGKP